MKTTVVLIFVLFGLNAFAATESRPLELPDTSKLNGDTSGQGGAKFEMICRSGGRSVKAGEPGYESCVTEAQSDITNRMNNSTQTGSATDSNFNIKLGR